MVLNHMCRQNTHTHNAKINLNSINHSNKSLVVIRIYSPWVSSQVGADSPFHYSRFITLDATSLAMTYCSLSCLYRHAEERNNQRAQDCTRYRQLSPTSPPSLPAIRHCGHCCCVLSPVFHTTVHGGFLADSTEHIVVIIPQHCSLDVS